MKIQTVKEIAVSRRARKGKAAGVDAAGGFWIPIDVELNVDGGDGRGQSDAAEETHLRITHYRNGTLTAVVQRTCWHENSGESVDTIVCPAVLQVTTHEELLKVLRSAQFEFDHCESLPLTVSAEGCKRLLEAIPELALMPPAPDEAVGTEIVT